MLSELVVGVVVWFVFDVSFDSGAVLVIGRSSRRRVLSVLVAR